MEIKQKIILSVLLVFGLVIFLKLNRLNMKRYNKSVADYNPKRYKKFNWMFSDKKIRLVEILFYGFTFIWIYMIWMDKVDFF